MTSSAQARPWTTLRQPSSRRRGRDSVPFSGSVNSCTPVSPAAPVRAQSAHPVPRATARPPLRSISSTSRWWNPNRRICAAGRAIHPRQPRQGVRTIVCARTVTGTSGAAPAAISRAALLASASGSAAGAPARTRQPLEARRAARRRSEVPSRCSIRTKSGAAAMRLSGNGQSLSASASHGSSGRVARTRGPIRPPPAPPRDARVSARRSRVVERPVAGPPDTRRIPARRSRFSSNSSRTAGESPISASVAGGAASTTPAIRTRYSCGRAAGRTLRRTRRAFPPAVLTTPRGACWNTAARKPRASLGATGNGCSSSAGVRRVAFRPSRAGCRLSSV